MNYPTETDRPENATKYNGWTNYETWNVALYIQNEEPLYREAVRYVRQCERLDEKVSYFVFSEVLSMLYGKSTPDGVSWKNWILNTDELDEMLEEL